MKLINKNISISELRIISVKMFSGLVKVVVDIKKEIMVIGADMHADEEKYLIELGSIQDDLWGINLYPDQKGEDFIEYDSMINVRPRINNFTRGINDEKIKQKIIKIVNKLVK